MMNYVYDSTSNSYNYANASAATNSYAANLQAARASKVAITTVSNSSCCCDNQNNTAQFLNQYQFLMKGLSSAANKLRNLNDDGLWNNLVAESSDTSKVEVTSRYKMRTKAEYDVNVTQLATEQISVSGIVKSDEVATIDGQFKLNIPGKSTSVNVNVETAGRTNREVQDDIAAQINDANAGLTASVIERDDKSYIEIKSKTGEINTFTVDGATDISVSQMAKDLRYTVNKNGVPLNDGNAYQSSRNNDIKIDGFQITANFKATGKSKISVTVDKEAVTKATEEFVNEYNKTLEFLVNNAHRGTGTSRVLDSFIRAPISKDSMKTIGITREESGRFTFDKKKFEETLKENTSKVYDILSDNYSIADGVYQDVQRALRTSTESLTNCQNNRPIININIIQAPPIFIGYNRFGYGTNPMLPPIFFNMLW